MSGLSGPNDINDALAKDFFARVFLFWSGKLSQVAGHSESRGPSGSLNQTPRLPGVHSSTVVSR